jgi:SRSO17 transposase
MVESPIPNSEGRLMFRIVRFPQKLTRFFAPLEGCFRWEHFQYFRQLVLAMAFAWGRRNISNLYRYLEAETHRTRFNNFVLVGRWDPAAPLRLKAVEMVQWLKPRQGETMYLILDDSKKRKRGKHMDAVDWVYDPVTGKKVRGHVFVTAVINFRGQTIPWGVRLYAKKEHCPKLGIPFRKTTELAAELVGELTPPPGVKVIVLFDSYYLCKTVVKACRAKGFHFASTLKANRNLFRGGRKLKAGPYIPRTYRRRAKKQLKLKRPNGTVTYRFVDAGWIGVSDLGPLHAVFSRRQAQKKTLGIVTDAPELTAAQIVEVYTHRWGIEVFFKDVKQHLGFGQYQNRSYRAAVTHLHLVCFAYALLTHLRIEGAQGKRKKPNAALMSTSEAQNELRRLVWRDLVAYLEELPSGDSLLKELERLLVA